VGHQDRAIAVKQHVPVDGFGTWSVKSGMLHVEPPFELLSGMVTLRVHIDPVPAGNAPLLIAPGSHKLGRVRKTMFARLFGVVAPLRVWPNLATSGFMRHPF